MDEVLVFALKGEEWTLPAEDVRQVLAPRPKTRVPGAGPSLLDLISWQARVIPVLSLGCHSGAGPLLVLEHRGELVALEVDEVRRFAPTDTQDEHGGGPPLFDLEQALDGR